MRHPLLESFRHYFLASPMLMGEFEAAVASEFDGWETNAAQEGKDPTIFFDWFLFDFILKEESNKIHSDLKPFFVGFRNSFFSLFCVKALHMGKGGILKEFFSEKEYQVQEDYFSKILRKGESFFGRIFPLGNYFILGFFIAPLPEEMHKAFQIRKKYLKISQEPFLLPSKETIQIILGLGERREWSELSAEELKNILLEKMERHGIKKEEGNEILSPIDQSYDLSAALDHLMGRAILKDQKEIETFLDLFKFYAQAISRKSKKKRSHMALLRRR